MAGLAIPETFSMEYLSRLPSSEFEITYKRFQPLVPPANDVYSGASANKVQFSISTAPNELIFAKDAYLNVDSMVSLNYAATNPNFSGSASDVVYELFNPRIDVTQYQRGPHWRYGPSVISRSEESVNNGSLKVHQNNDSVLANVFNTLRCQSASRHYDFLLDSINGLQSSGCDASKNHYGFNVVYNNNGAPTTIPGKPKNFRIPLGMISDIANCTSVVPSGLFNSYSTQAWRFDITLPKIDETLVWAGVPGTDDLTLPVGLRSKPNVVVNAGDGHRNVEIWVPVIRVLRPEYMELLLSQYEKRAMTSLGGVTMPVSLRLNTLGFNRYGPYPLNQNQGKYYFRLSTTQPSVRALQWTIYKSDVFENHYTDAGNSLSGSSRATLALPANQLRVTAIETRVGTRQIHDCVQESDARETKVADFLALNERRSASLFSPFPYWVEANNHFEKPSDVRKTLQFGVPSVPSQYGAYNLQSGVISFENADHDDNTYTTAKMSTGINCSQVGAIELTLGFGRVNADGVTLDAGPGLNSTYEIVFQTVSDEVLEVSPVGIQYITQETVLG